MKIILGLAKARKVDESYAAYASSSRALVHDVPEADQRQGLKLMVLAKGIPTFPGPAIVAAHKSALVPIKALVAAHDEPADYELLGLCRCASATKRGRGPHSSEGSISSARAIRSRRCAGRS